MRKIAAIAAFVLTFQFAIALGFLVLVWPESPSGIAALDRLLKSSISYVVGLSAKPASFLLANLYTAVWCVPIIVVALALREEMPRARHRMQLALIAASISAAFFLAGGIVPMVAWPQMTTAADVPAQRAVSGMVAGLILTATSAAGFAVLLIGSAALSTGYLPRLLALLLFVSGALEICEFAVPACLVLDPILGIAWTFWLGMCLQSGLHNSGTA